MTPRPPESSDAELAAHWRQAAADAVIVARLEAVYDFVSDAVAERGPACWASGRCCNFDQAGHLLYVTGLEAAYTVQRAHDPRQSTSLPMLHACPYQEGNLCGAHPMRPLGCRVYFCDRSAQEWQRELAEEGIARVRAIHDEHGVPYRYGEWRRMLALIRT